MGSNIALKLKTAQKQHFQLFLGPKIYDHSLEQAKNATTYSQIKFYSEGLLSGAVYYFYEQKNVKKADFFYFWVFKTVKI